MSDHYCAVCGEAMNVDEFSQSYARFDVAMCRQHYDAAVHNQEAFNIDMSGLRAARLHQDRQELENERRRIQSTGRFFT